MRRIRAAGQMVADVANARRRAEPLLRHAAALAAQSALLDPSGFAAKVQAVLDAIDTLALAAEAEREDAAS